MVGSGSGLNSGCTNIGCNAGSAWGDLRFCLLILRIIARAVCVCEKKRNFTQSTRTRDGTHHLPHGLFRSLRPHAAPGHRALRPRQGAGVEPLPPAALDPRQVRYRSGHRLGTADARRRGDRPVLQHGQSRALRPPRHHRRGAGFQGPLRLDPQHHRPPLRGRAHRRRVFPQKGVPPLRVLRHARHRLVGRALPGVPRDRPPGQPRIHLFGPAEPVADRSVALRPRAADHLAPGASQARGDHGLRRQPGLPHHRSVPDRGGGEISAFRTT